MSDLLHDDRGAPIYVDHICWLTAEDDMYTLDWPTPDDYFKVLPHIYMEDHYYGRVGTLTRSLLADGRRVTAGDLALRVLERMSTKPHWDWLILAQTCPERHALNAPLARMLETATWQVEHPLGITHMGALAGTEAIQVALWSLFPNERAVIVLVEQRILHDDGPVGYSQQSESHGDLADMAVALEAGLGQGALQIHYAGKRIIRSDEPATFASEVLDIIRDLMDDHAAEHVILQSRLGWRISGSSVWNIHPSKSVCVPRTDYQSGDVWIQLADKLEQGGIKPDDRVMLISWDDDRMLSACCVHVMHMPMLSRLTMNQEIKTS
ncbi:hypothetical protein C0Q44_02950 [Paenibacillus sp. PCH8]|uniref:hypothetical protein n=1 Tax=Paenibacillus sp. PCH8 TaxID=2066524 RepID=UPI000CF8557A|nr:hypothetical protein [Paenibacillus sp. PCH8]PQP83663.1 hypothetical protein C0Q44_02950 [Paenibacillus sp. PCH8]